MFNKRCPTHGSDHPAQLCPLTGHVPDSCWCQPLSQCCGSPPTEHSDVAKDSQAGICAQCHDHTGFEPSEDMTWQFKGKSIYGDDADGNRGVPLWAWECRECGDEREILGL